MLEVFRGSHVVVKDLLWDPDPAKASKNMVQDSEKDTRSAFIKKEIHKIHLRKSAQKHARRVSDQSSSSLQIA